MKESCSWTEADGKQDPPLMATSGEGVFGRVVQWSERCSLKAETRVRTPLRLLNIYIMGLISKLIKHAVKTPINLTKDIITMGGALSDEESALKKQVKEFEKDMDENDGLI